MLERMGVKGNTPLLLVGVQTCTPLWKLVLWFLRKLGNNLLQDPVILLLVSYLKDAQSYHKGMRSTMFITALLKIARTCKQCRYLSTKEWIKKLWHIYAMEYLFLYPSNAKAYMDNLYMAVLLNLSISGLHDLSC